MKNLLIIGLVVAFAGSAATATDMSFSVEVGASNTYEYPAADAGQTLEYEVYGRLDDSANGGLALVGFDLVFSGGDLVQADTPTADPMLNFVRDLGITNPLGYGGTVIGGDLIQIGGGQNTILNYADNAPFPVGTVIVDVAKEEWVLLVTGTLTLPAEAATLSVMNPFANVIQEGQDGNPFWATEAATIGTITNLSLVPSEDAVLVDTSTACDSSLWRSADNFVKLTFDGDITAPNPGDIAVEELQAGGVFGTDLSAGFTFTVDPGDSTSLLIWEVGTQLTHRKWFGFRNASWAGVDAFEVHYVLQVGDANEDLRVTSGDASLINAGILIPNADDDERREINGDDRVTSGDTSMTNSKILSLPVGKPTGHVCLP